MALIPEPLDTTVSRIYEVYKKNRKGRVSIRLGAGSIGKECNLEVWYKFRWAAKSEYSGQMSRLFDTGDREELRVIRDLRNIGCTVYDVNPQTGKQFFFSDLGGHFVGFMDCAVLGIPEAPKEWHVFDIKTYNKKRFKEFVSKGVKESDYVYYAQLQMYMGWSGMLRAGLFAVEKDTDELYLERIHFSQEEFDKLRNVARRVIFSEKKLPKISNSPGFYKCRFCDFKSICHESAIPNMNCRTCLHATAEENGTWTCAKFNKTLSKREQEERCEKHLFLPAMIPYEQVDAGDGFVQYRIIKTQGFHVTESGIRNYEGNNWHE